MTMKDMNAMPKPPASRPSRRHAVASAPIAPWLLGYAALYLAVLTVGMIMAEQTSPPDREFTDALLDAIIAMLYIGPIALLFIVAALGAVRLLRTARWYWFRLGTVFIVFLPSLVLLRNDFWCVFLASHLIIALTIIQPDSPDDPPTKPYPAAHL